MEGWCPNLGRTLAALPQDGFSWKSLGARIDAIDTASPAPGFAKADAAGHRDFIAV